MLKNDKEITLLAKTLFGLENVLAEELQKIGASNIQVLNRAVQYMGNKAILYKSNLLLRTAIKILVPLKVFYAKDQHSLYKHIQEINWSDYLDIHSTFVVRSVVHSKYFKHSLFVSQRAKDAIVDQLRDDQGNRPSVDTENPDIFIDIHLSEDKVTVSLDSSGHPLNQRGYRKSAGDAPLNEVLAAGLILLSGWDGMSNFIDPMCGSGTLLIEAAMIASNTAPNLLRKEFAFMRWANYDKKLWIKTLNDAKISQRLPDKKKIKIIGSDISMGMLQIAQRNIGGAGLSNIISLRNKSFSQFIAPAGTGVLVFNPPYGERLKVKQIEDLYTSIGNNLKNNWKNYEAWILSSNYDAFKHIGLKPHKKFKLFNGSLECRFSGFEVFEGTRKDFLEMNRTEGKENPEAGQNENNDEQFAN
ncbi:MAG: THUMP domain-containing protein [Bacteroidales bacterium]